MEPWSVGLIALLVVGVAVILYGAFHDRANNRRRAAEMLAPPPRTIPSFSPSAVGPRYVTELQARRPPAGTPAEANPDLARDLADPSTITLPVGYASRDFVTDTASARAVLDDPLVLICDDEVQSVRELLPAIELARRGSGALVVVAPDLAREVLGTLEVNAIQRKLPVVVIRAAGAERRRIGLATGAQPISRSERQSGYLAADRVGGCLRWISTAKQSYVVPAEVRT